MISSPEVLSRVRFLCIGQINLVFLEIIGQEQHFGSRAAKGVPLTDTLIAGFWLVLFTNTLVLGK